MSEKQKSIVYVIGAGFSAGLGFPTINDLLPKLWKRPVKAEIREGIEKVIRFHHPLFDADNFETYPTIEELLSEMQANDKLFNSTRAATGKFTSEDLKKRRRKLLHEMAKWFHELKKHALCDKPDWLTQLVKTFKEENAVIISFNWDLILDDLLFGDKLNKSSYGFDPHTKGPQLIKPHGSLNWYKKKISKTIKHDKKFELFGSGANEVFVFKPMRAPVSHAKRSYMPLIVPPVYAKEFEEPLFHSLWQKTVHALSTATEVRFLGYSLSEADFHARFVLRCGFYNQEEGVLQESSERAPPTGRAKVVVVDPCRQSFERIKATVGREDCEFHRQKLSCWVNAGGHSDI